MHESRDRDGGRAKTRWILRTKTLMYTLADFKGESQLQEDSGERERERVSKKRERERGERKFRSPPPSLLRDPRNLPDTQTLRGLPTTLSGCCLQLNETGLIDEPVRVIVDADIKN